MMDRRNLRAFHPFARLDRLLAEVPAGPGDGGRPVYLSIGEPRDQPPGFVAEVVAFAFGLAASAFFPAIVLGIFDPRTTKEGAIAGMVAGLLFTSTYIVTVAPGFGIGLDPWFFGIAPQGIGTVGMALSFFVTFTLSRLTAPPPKGIRDMVESIRIPRVTKQRLAESAPGN